MEILPILFFSIDIFLTITYLGIFIYLGYLFFRWEDTSLGIWALGSLFVSITHILHSSSIILLVNSNPNYIAIFKLAITTSFVTYWLVGSANLLARRTIKDIILIVLLTLPLGFIVPYIINNLSVLGISGVPQEDFVSGFTTFDLLFFLFYAILYTIIARDSQLIYNESIKDETNKTRKSIAITHLLAWHFWVVGTASMRYFSKFTGNFIYIGVSFILLLVPILTLSSRPFNWSREGHEPILLLLIDQYGNPIYSWMNNKDSPLLLEGSTIATINNMFQNLVEEPVKSMTINFHNTTLYTQNSNDFLTILLTTGYHKSFEVLLNKIHRIMITDSVKSREFGIPGYEFPTELKWLLAQLLPGTEPFQLSEENDNFIKKMLIKSGLKFYK